MISQGEKRLAQEIVDRCTKIIKRYEDAKRCGFRSGDSVITEFIDLKVSLVQKYLIDPEITLTEEFDKRCEIYYDIKEYHLALANKKFKKADELREIIKYGGRHIW